MRRETEDEERLAKVRGQGHIEKKVGRGHKPCRRCKRRPNSIGKYAAFMHVSGQHFSTPPISLSGPLPEPFQTS